MYTVGTESNDDSVLCLTFRWYANTLWPRSKLTSQKPLHSTQQVIVIYSRTSLRELCFSTRSGEGRSVGWPSRTSKASRRTSKQPILHHRRLRRRFSNGALHCMWAMHGPTLFQLVSLQPGADCCVVSFWETHPLPCFRLSLVKIRGKRNREVPVLLTVDMTLALKLLVKSRNDLVPSTNRMVFALPKSVKNMEGWTALRDVTKNLQLQDAEAVTSTSMRKYICTTSQVWQHQYISLLSEFSIVLFNSDGGLGFWASVSLWMSRSCLRLTDV